MKPFIFNEELKKAKTRHFDTNTGISKPMPHSWEEKEVLDYYYRLVLFAIITKGIKDKALGIKMAENMYKRLNNFKPSYRSAISRGFNGFLSMLGIR